MSRVSKKQTVRQRVRRREVAAAKVSRESPCGRKPAAIDSGDVTLTFLETDGQKGSKYRLRVTWPEVTDDADGFPTTVDRYIVHLQTSEDGSTWDSDYRRKVVEVKDGDDNSTAKAIFKGITRKRYYRVRVRAKDAKGCKSDLPGTWSSSARAGGSDTVPAVGAITKTRVGPRRIEFDWDDVEHPDFDRYKVVILKADSEGGTFSVVRTRYTRQSNIAVHVADTDKTKWWKVRVRVQLQKNPDGTTDESSDTDSSADQADDTSITGNGRQVRVWTKPGLVRRKEYEAKWYADRAYKLVRVRAVVGKHDPDAHPEDDGAPRGSAILLNLRKYDADYDDDIGGFTALFDSDAKMEIPANKHRDNAWIEEGDPDINWTTIQEDESISVKVSQIGSTYPGAHLRVFLVLEPV